jgi:glutamate/tyrosine decarboxylase-like PLP-dependent enzyme
MPLSSATLADQAEASSGVGPEPTLDPPDWTLAGILAHRMVDDAVDYLSTVRDRPVWRPLPAEVRAAFAAPLPRCGMPLAEVYDQVRELIMPWPMGNIHPRFWSWYMGAGTLTGALAEFLAAVQGSNLGGGEHAAAYVDQQVVGWFKEIVGYPAAASGTLVAGGSMANLLAIAVARDAKAGVNVREHGLDVLPRPLRFYCSDQVHNCIRRAVEALGHGRRAIRTVATDCRLAIDIDALGRAIEDDRAAGFEPAVIVASAGTVNTGAIDDIAALADLAADAGVWLHVDGCIGGLVAMAPENAWRVRGIERADSIALDPHKWLHAPFEASCLLVRDAAAHLHAFADVAEYLERAPRGLASGPWLYHYGLQTSRAFRALKLWMTLKEYGAETLGRLIDRNIRQAATLAELVAAEPSLELTAPPGLNIVCFRHRGSGDAEARKALNVEIMLRLQESGTAALSDTTICGEHTLRVAIANHRTQSEDLALLVREVVRLGKSMESVRERPL